jgi:hypothetical protein
MKDILKSIKYRLQLFDGLWSIPLAFLVFIYFGYISTVYFGDPLISIEYLQQVLMAGLILVFANFVAFLGGYFNFRGLQKYFYSQEIKVETRNKLTAWQRIKLYLWVYFGLLSSFLVILWLVMTATA